MGSIREFLKRYWKVILAVLVPVLIVSGWVWDHARLSQPVSEETISKPYYVYQFGQADQYLNFDESKTSSTKAKSTADSATLDNQIISDESFAWTNPNLPIDVSLGIADVNSETAAALGGKAYAAERVPTVYYIYREGYNQSTNSSTTYLKELNVNTGKSRVVRQVTTVGSQNGGPLSTYKDYYGVRFNNVKKVLALSTTADIDGAHQSGRTKILLVDPTKSSNTDREIIADVNNIQTMLWSNDGQTLFFLSADSQYSLTAYKYSYATQKLDQLQLTGDSDLPRQNSGDYSYTFNFNSSSFSQDYTRVSLEITGKLKADINNNAKSVRMPCSITLSSGSVTCLKQTQVPNSRLFSVVEFNSGYFGLTTTESDHVSQGAFGGPKWLAATNKIAGTYEEHKNTKPISSYAVSADGNLVILHADTTIQKSVPKSGDFVEYRLWDRQTNKIEDISAFPGSNLPGFSIFLGFNGSKNNFLASNGKDFWNYNIQKKSWTKITH